MAAGPQPSSTIFYQVIFAPIHCDPAYTRMAGRFAPRLARMLAAGMMRPAAAVRPAIALPETLACRAVMAARVVPTGLRAVHASAVSPSSPLSTVLQAELEYEKQEYAQPEVGSGQRCWGVVSRTWFNAFAISPRAWGGGF